MDESAVRPLAERATGRDAVNRTIRPRDNELFVQTNFLTRTTTHWETQAAKGVIQLIVETKSYRSGPRPNDAECAIRAGFRQEAVAAG